MKEMRSNTIVTNNILYYTIIIWRNQIKYDCKKKYIILCNNKMKEKKIKCDCNTQYTLPYNNNMKEIRSNTIVTNNILYYTIMIWRNQIKYDCKK